MIPYPINTDIWRVARYVAILALFTAFLKLRPQHSYLQQANANKYHVLKYRFDRSHFRRLIDTVLGYGN